MTRVVRGHPGDPRWVRPALLTLLTATAVLYLWGLGASGWGNSFYAAAVQAGTKSWKAFFFGSFDAANSITVDKPPGALWVMELSARLFGVNSWSLLVPQALEGVAAVALIYATVRRWFGPGAALLAGLVVAVTPVAALMFRFNNPDALLVLLLVGAAYAVTRAVETASTAWLVLAGALVGMGFLTKMLQALLVLPALALSYLIAAPTSLGRRVRQLLIAAGAMALAAGWWVAVVQLVPAVDRPYIGGSTNNSIINLILGYNGFGRLTGNETGSVGGAPTGARAGGNWGPTGITRLFNTEMGTTISWLLPAALLLLVVGLAVSRRGRRTDRTRAALVLWGGWLLVTGSAFSLSRGIIHPYYNVALVPAVGAVVGIGAVLLWRLRHRFVARAALASATVLTAWWSYELLARTPGWLPWLRSSLLVLGVLAAGWLIAVGHRGGLAPKVAGAAAILAALGGTAGYTVATAAQTHAGAIPSLGPAGSAGAGPGGAGSPAGGLAGGGFPANALRGGVAGAPAAGGGSATVPPAPGGANRGRVGGLLQGSAPTKALTAALEKNASDYTWVAATVGANEASGYQLATGDAVLPIGGFNGTDPSPTPAQFEHLVAEGKIHYFIPGGLGTGPGAPGGGSTNSTAGQITTWVERTFRAVTVGGTTLYDLSSPVTTTSS